MKFIHLSDLHLGRRVNEFSMLEDQRHILGEILRVAREQAPGALLVSGDIYDKAVPCVEAVQLLEEFLVRLHALGIAVLMIAGNHDSAQRVAFAAPLLGQSGVHIARAFDGTFAPVRLQGIDFWLLPYLKPAQLRRFYPETEINSYNDALSAVFACIELDISCRNVLLCHQFVTGAQPSESEELSIGGAENVDAALFGAFDYVALGHLHRPQHVTRETLRYCGTPLKYSFSEAGHKKTLTLVEIADEISVTEIPLVPKRDMRVVKGSYEEIVKRENYIDTNTDDYMHITLTDEEAVPDAFAKLRVIYPNLMKLDYDNRRTRARHVIGGAGHSERKPPLELFGELYALQNGQAMSDTQTRYARDLFTEIWENEA